MLDAVARIWRVREKVEWEAAELFGGLAASLRDLSASTTVAKMAEQAAHDERDHAARCRRIIETCAPGLPPLAPQLGFRLGPSSLAPRDRLLYGCVAISCVTESLSAALLLEMRRTVRDDLIGETVHHILRDEVDHSRLGWAHLAHEAKQRDLSWLSPYIPGMVREALTGESAPPSEGAATAGKWDLSAYGILSPEHVDKIVNLALREVVLPGLESFGIDAGQPGATAASP